MKSPLSRRTIIFIVGPTAIGKTRLAIKLAEKIHGEIISCDSMQIYKGMDILSQAPSEKEKKSAKHHLVGILDPIKEYSVAAFRVRAVSAIKSVTRRGKAPIVAGGSGLYMKALVDGLFPAPEADVKLRKRLQTFASRYGSKKLYERLLKIDSAAAQLIHPNDVRRIIRALEIFELTGRTMTELKANTRGLKDSYDVKIFGLIAPRKKIYSRIDSRVDKIFADGAVDEARKLLKKRLSKTAKAVLGLKEIAGYLEGEYDLESAKDMVKINTRHFAKRQLSWFRSDDRIIWCDVTRSSDERILKRIMKGAV